MVRTTNYELLNPVLIIISIGLIAYLAYLMSLLIFGSSFRTTENMILILVFAASLVIITIIIKQETDIEEKLSKVIGRKGPPDEGSEDDEITYHKILKEIEKVLKTTKMKEAGDEEMIEENETGWKRPKYEASEQKPKDENAKVELREETKLAKLLKKKVDREKLYEIEKLLKTGMGLRATNAKAAREAFVKAKEIYNSLSQDAKHLIDGEVARLINSKIGSKEPGEEKG